MSAAWLDQACSLLEAEPAIVRVTIAGTRGSSPRESGTTMVVAQASQWGTIGGGHLEWQAVEQARRMLAVRDTPAVQVEHLRLGPDLAQCCGGEVSLWLERVTAGERETLRRLRGPLVHGGLRTAFDGGAIHRLPMSMPPPLPALLTRNGTAVELAESHTTATRPLWIFGAGHVGQAVARLLRDLPDFSVKWIDNRPDILPPRNPDAGMLTRAAEPAELVALAPAGTLWLVLTHDHELDFQLCAAILARGDAGWLGLIGSKSKAARFRSRLRRAGHADSAIAQLTCPVGLTTIHSKLPAAIAVGIAAQLLEIATRQAADAAAPAGCDPACGRCRESRHA